MTTKPKPVEEIAIKIIASCRDDTEEGEGNILQMQCLSAITQALQAERARADKAIEALKIYKSCRHACIKCFCTKEAAITLGELE